VVPLVVPAQSQELRAAPVVQRREPAPEYPGLECWASPRPWHPRAAVGLQLGPPLQQVEAHKECAPPPSRPAVALPQEPEVQRVAGARRGLPRAWPRMQGRASIVAESPQKAALSQVEE
jgi:hypothetical protein